MSTNSMGSIGVTSKTAGSFYYALLVNTATYAGAPSTSITDNPFDSSWKFSGAMATNNTFVAGGLTGGTATIANWAPGSTAYVEVVGWSANMGTTWAAAAALISGGNLNLTDLWGNSLVGYLTAGGVGTPPSPGAPVFTTTGIPAGFQLTSVPEPATVALIGLGGLGLAMIRRRK